MNADALPHPPDEGSLPAELEQRIRAVIRREFPGASTAELVAGTPILGKGLLDSVEALALATAIEAEFGILIEDDELSVSLFANLRTLADHVGRKLAAGL